MLQIEDDQKSPFDDQCSWGALDHENNISQNQVMKVEKIDHYDHHHHQGLQHMSHFGSMKPASNNDLPKQPPSSPSLAERRAAKCGFNASKIVPRFEPTKSTTTSPGPALAVPVSVAAPPPPPVSSPFLTIPPGISPAALLDSPVMLPNRQAQSSPTTGSFQFSSLVHDDKLMMSSDGDGNSVISFSSQWKPQPLGGDNLSMSCVSSPAADQPSPHSKFPSEAAAPIKNCATDALVQTNAVNTTPPDGFRANLRLSNVNLAHKQIIPQKREHNHEERGKQHLLGLEKKVGMYPQAAAPKSSDDGYNWRKYGQKHVKGSEYPRSYFKCTHPNCLVKKKVERSHDGEITEIVYKGVHNHPKSQLNGRSILFGPSNPYSGMSEISDGTRSSFKVEYGMNCGNLQQPVCKDLRVCSDWRADGLEVTSSTSVLTESSDPLSSTPPKSMGAFESAGAPDLLSSTLARHEGEDEDRTTQASTSLGDDDDGEGSEAKRRKKDSCSTESIGPSRSTREPKVVVQIESDIDVLDDGYRWRKYGQKVVKGNPNPRSYYKCTTAGCPVRKHVERASDNPKSVITTYEGKHNHEVPSKTNTNANCNIGNLSQVATNAHPAMALTRHSSFTKPAIQIQDYPLHFDTKPGRCNEFIRNNFLGNIVSDMAMGASSLYQLTFPSLSNPLPYNHYLINTNPVDICSPVTSSASLIPNSPMPLPLTLPGSSNVALGSYHFNNYPGPSAAIHPSSIGGQQQLQQQQQQQQQLRESNSRLIKPKEEQKDDHDMYDTCLSIPDQDSTTSFLHVMGNFLSS